MTPRLEVLWHRVVGGRLGESLARLLVALEEEPRVECPNGYCDKGLVIADATRTSHSYGTYCRVCRGSGSIPMPSGTRVELVQRCDRDDPTSCDFVGTLPDGSEQRFIHYTCGGSGVISLGVATLEEVVPWLKVIPWPSSDDDPPDDSIITVDLEGTNAVWFPPDLYDDLTLLSPKYVALCGTGL